MEFPYRVESMPDSPETEQPVSASDIVPGASDTETCVTTHTSPMSPSAMAADEICDASPEKDDLNQLDSINTEDQEQSPDVCQTVDLPIVTDESLAEESSTTDDQSSSLMPVLEELASLDEATSLTPVNINDAGAEAEIEQVPDFDPADSSPIDCENDGSGEISSLLEDFCSLKLPAESDSESGRAENFCSGSDGVPLNESIDYLSLTASEQEENVLCSDGSCLLLPTPQITDHDTVSPGSPGPPVENSNEAAPLAPAEWCEHCGALAPTASPSNCVSAESLCEVAPVTIEHLPHCQHYNLACDRQSVEGSLHHEFSRSTSDQSLVCEDIDASTAQKSLDFEDDSNKLGIFVAYDYSGKTSALCDDGTAEDAGQKQLPGTDESDGDSSAADVSEDTEEEQSNGSEVEVFSIEDLDGPINEDSTNLPITEIVENSLLLSGISPDHTNADSESSLENPAEPGHCTSPTDDTRPDNASVLEALTDNLILVPQPGVEAAENFGAEEQQQSGRTDVSSDCEAGDENVPKKDIFSQAISALENLTSKLTNIDLSPETCVSQSSMEIEGISQGNKALLADKFFSENLNFSSPVTCHDQPTSISNGSSVNSVQCTMKVSDSTGPSPEPSDLLDISCGISVFFEKCKNRREPSSAACSDSAADQTPLTIVSTIEKISSELEKSSIADCSYVPDVTAACSPDLVSEGTPSNNTALLSPERNYGILSSPRNFSILEETEDDVGTSKNEDLEKPLFKLPSEKVPNFKDPSHELVVTSAPCSPVPLSHRTSSMANIAQRKRKLNSCVRRRVSFPENDLQLITSYLEPVDPWERMKKSVESEEILEAYLSSCRSHNCQPIPSVVNQIAALPLNVPGRVECFSLRNCKLELSQCECLEEIFKRVQFVCIDLENCSLTDDTVIPLVDMIEFYDSTTQLNISGSSQIGMRGWQACSRMLKKNHSVRSLNARGTNLNEANMPILGKALKLGSRLHTLHLENCNLTGRPLVTLTAALKLNDTLVKLYLADNRLGSSDCIQIGNLMKTNLTIKLLDLRNNNLQDTGCAHVCEGIAEQSKTIAAAATSADLNSIKDKNKLGLNSLVLWNNHMTVSSAKFLAAMMLSSPSMETLNIGRNSVSNDGAIRLKDALLRNKSLKRLYLHATKIGDEGAVALAELIAESKNIERVDLRENSIKVAGLMALAHSLRHNTSIIQMDLNSNPRSEPLDELAEKHMSLLLEIKEYTQRNRTEAQALKPPLEGKKTDSEDYYHDPDFRKLSLSSEIEGSQTLEIPVAIPSPSCVQAVDVASGAGLATDEHKKYRSPSPSPCASPVPSPSLSPVPSSPYKNRFKVSKVTPVVSPAGSVTNSPILNENACAPLPPFSGSLISSVAVASSSAPTCTISTTSRPVFHHPQPATRNRFLSGGRFTVTRVCDKSIAASPISKCKSLSLSQIPQLESTENKEPSSPKIVISSPAKIERGFSLEESNTEEKQTNTPVVSLKSESQDEWDFSEPCVKTRSDSSESDEVFAESVSESEASTVVLRAPARAEADALSPGARPQKDLTDSGFLEESGVNTGELNINLPARTSQDGDRDSLFSNTSDPEGHSPLSAVPPCGEVKLLSPTNSVHPDSTSSSSADQVSSQAASEAAMSIPASLGLLFKLTGLSDECSQMNNSSRGKNSSVQNASPSVCEVTRQTKRAPLATIENGSLDTDSEDSELTTQSSDSTHSDEVRITLMEAAAEPLKAWGGDVEEQPTSESTQETAQYSDDQADGIERKSSDCDSEQSTLTAAPDESSLEGLS
ncbi:hypothetical protein HAZT_HAZT001002 [Hyalella azteca]|nr:hypothetical protein HAZT_HAZT001002 [Hyalella azteca]